MKLLLMMNYQNINNINFLEKYRRLKIAVYNKNEQCEIDLAENKDWWRYNNQFRYWLVCIDVYSRYVWVELLKKKSSTKGANKFENILKKAEDTPQKIQCNEGTEFQDIRKHLSKKYDFKNNGTSRFYFNRWIRLLSIFIRYYKKA